MRDIIDGLDGFDFTDISDKVLWTDKNGSLKNVETAEEKLDMIKSWGLTFGADLELKDKTVLLVDDMYYSGVTMQYIAMKMKELGANAVRYRVWVNPSDGWCNKADVLVKAKRAQALGLAIMIDFHYSDSWADPSKQNPPAAWKNMDADAMASALAAHTKDVLQALKEAQVDVAWVQVGNETNTGMSLPVGAVSNGNTAGFVKLANAGYDAVKAIYPSALVITHHSNAQDLAKNQWFYDLVIKGGAKFDTNGYVARVHKALEGDERGSGGLVKYGDNFLAVMVANATQEMRRFLNILSNAAG